MRLSTLRSLPSFRRRPRKTRPTHTRFARSHARLTLALTPPALVLVLWAAWSAADPHAAEAPDREYDTRLSIARAAQAEHPDRPLGLVLGTSRTAMAFQPEQLAEPDGVYWVNAGRIGAGPIFSRVMLHRLLRDGVRPAVVVFEVMPAFFVTEDPLIFYTYLGPRDLWVASWYSARPFQYDWHIIESRVRRLTDSAPAADAITPPVYHPRGGYPLLAAEVDPATRARQTAFSREHFAPALRNMTVQSGADRAFRTTLRSAADAGIRVVLLRASEGPVFRSWYDPAALARFDDYLARVAGEYGLPVLDARLWLEEEDFADSHHTLKRGAEKFTARFAREMAPITSR